MFGSRKVLVNANIITSEYQDPYLKCPEIVRRGIQNTLYKLKHCDYGVMRALGSTP